MKRVTPKSLQERQANKAKYADLPKLKDILVDLSVKNTPKVTRTLRLVGEACEFAEIQDKKRIPGSKQTERIPFPDANKNSSPTRIGHDNPSECPWRKMGYIASRRFVQKCLEKQDDGTWVPKILVKGPSVFDLFADWEEGRRIEASDSEEPVSTFLGGDLAPQVRVVCSADSSKLGGVDYKVHVGTKDMELTEDLINLLRVVREPSADELNSFKNSYNEDRDADPSMPEWRDYYAFGHDTSRIFKFTPPQLEDSTPATVSSPEDSAEDFEDVTPSAPKVETDEKVDDELEGLNW